ncbi:MAG: YitT family protein [Clostridiales bacterium]|nr:YitT family protein [Clostridiales bacterium]
MDKTKLKKPTGSQVKEFIIDNILWIAGGIIYSVGINMFAVSNKIALSGMTGLSVVINYLTGFPVGAANFCLNVPLLILALIFVGKVFVFKTVWVVALMSLALDSLAGLLPAYTGDRMLAALFCGILQGVGLALILMRGATSGGTDIIGRLVRVKWPHFSMGRVILVSNLVTVVISAAAYRKEVAAIESAMYAVVVLLLSTSVLDYILYGINKGKMLMIVTDKADEMSEAITSQTPRGVTVLPVKGGYTGESKNMLIVAVRDSEVARINKIIKQVDDKTFTIITEAGEILGKGFKFRE